MEFEIDDNEFECFECGKPVIVAKAGKKAKPVECKKCGKGYMVSKNPHGDGLIVNDEYEAVFEDDADEDSDEFEEEE